MNSEILKVLVVGGSGFIGSHVADELSRLGYEVTIFDSHESPWKKSDQNFISGDLLNKAEVMRITKGYDVIYHFAAIADISEASSRRLDAIETNIMGSVNLIESCIANNIKTFVFASTVYVYSDKGSFYRATKQAVEGLIEEYAKAENLNYRILRYGSLYGPRAQDWNGLRRYVTSIIEKGTVRLRSQGLAKREYIHVQDAAKLSVLALQPKYKNQHLLITGGQSISARELIGMLEEIIDKKIEIEFHESSDDSHYILTPYKYVPKHGIKMTSPDFIDFGQGLLEVIEEVTNQMNQNQGMRRYFPEN